MNKNSTDLCNRLVAPTLTPGEQIEVTEAVQIGKVSFAKKFLTTLALYILSRGTRLASAKPTPYFLVLTNKRLILIENHIGRVGKIRSAFPRDQITAGPLQAHVLTLSMQVAINGTEHQFSWGRIQGGMARTVAAALVARPIPKSSSPPPTSRQ
jgi:hypothetical protein